jgi:ABC-type nitrate/sulfonate/bicarbonate transport system substrate-binding protein
MSPLRIVGFAGAANLPIWAAQGNGIFARHGLEVTLEITPNSKAMAADLFAGRYDLAMTAVDNIVAYVEGQGEAALPGHADFVALFGADDGMLNLMAAPDVADIAALRGRAVAVDAMTTGFAFVLKEMLARHGIADAVEWVPVGGGAQRLAALLDGKQAATLLNTPLDLVAEARGFRRLARARDVVGPYQGIVGAARPAVVADKHATLAAFMRAFREAIAWLAAHETESIALLQEKAKMTPEVAARAHAALLDPASGLYRDLRVDLDGLVTVLRLRGAHGLPRKALADAARYLDLSVRDAALA